MPGVKSASKKGLLVKIVLAGVLAIVVVVLTLRGMDVKGLVVRAMAIIGNAGPWVFFSAMAVLPAIGFPLLAFALPAGPAFSAQLGVTGVLAAYGAAIAVNLALTYWLGRYALRPWVERLATRFGYRIPPIEKDEHIEVTLLLRITPGPPFFVQSYLLSLGKVAFFTYLWISWLVAMLYAVGIVKFGKALMEGQKGQAVFGVSLLVAAVIIVHLVRKHYGKRAAQPAGDRTKSD